MAERSMPKDNSNKARKEEQLSPQAAPITTGKMRKKTLAMKFADMFFEGNLKSAIHYMIYDAAIPQAKNMLLKAFEILLFNKASGTNYTSYYNSGPYYQAPQTSYGSYYVTKDGQRRDVNSQKSASASVAKIRKISDPRLIVVEDRGIAERILEDLRMECNSEYGQVSVAKLFSMVDIQSDWAMTGYGWKRCMLDYPRASVKSCADGWCFDLPDPVPID